MNLDFLFYILKYLISLYFISNNDVSTIAHLKNTLSQRFKFKDSGDLRYFLGLVIARSSSSKL